MLMRRAYALLTVALALPACTDDPAPGDQPGPGDWQPLITASWSLPPGGERTDDLNLASVDRDRLIAAIRPLAPVGTHHTLLATGDAGLTNTNVIYASGVGTEALVFPEGTALRLTAGSLLGLQLHVYNTSDQELSGTSGIEVRELDPATVVDEIDLFLPGPENLTIAPGTTTTISGTCTVTEPQQVFALFPHMHQLGTHLKTTLTIGGVPQVLHDAPYSFEHQAIESFAPIQLMPGDSITTECTWDNPTAQPVTYGESSDTEMCYSILFRTGSRAQEFCDD
ncbi:MAG: hypothetical protein R3B06_12960 [Kofleriaceae bacterium]